MVAEYEPCNSAPEWGPRAPGWDAASRFSGMAYPLASAPTSDYGTRLPENGNLEVGKREKMFWNPRKSR